MNHYSQQHTLLHFDFCKQKKSKKIAMILDIIAPLALIISMLMIFLGPAYYPKVNICILLGYNALFIIISLAHLIKFCLFTSKLIKKVKEYEASDVELKAMPESNKNLVFIIPNYKEPESLIIKTVDQFASHPYSSGYIIVLAMEQAEEGSLEKAQSIQKKYDGVFKHFAITVHPFNVPNEARGKASNVNYATRELYKLIESMDIKIDSVYLTIADADAQVSHYYVSELQKAIDQSEDPHNCIYAPPAVFSRNSLDVPAAVRLQDIMWSLLVTQNLQNSRGLAFPVSSYTLSLDLCHRVDYWDVDEAAIAEDMHMTLKCWFNTKGLTKTIPIYVPINYTNVQSSSYLSTIGSKFNQAKRHHQGISDVGYTLTRLITTTGWKCSFWNRFLVCCHVLESHILPCSVAWVITFGLLVASLLNVNEIYSDPNFAIVFKAAQVTGGVASLPYLIAFPL